MERRYSTKSPQEVLVLCRERDVKAVDLKFTDFLGKPHHLTVPVAKLTEDKFEEGFGFDGSNIPGCQAMDETDMLLVPLPTTAWIDPFPAVSTLALTCSILDPITREETARDPRHIARRAENYLLQTGIADSVLIGPETEFYLFDSVAYDQSARTGFYAIDRSMPEESQSKSLRIPRDSDLRSFGEARGGSPRDWTNLVHGEIMQKLIDCGIDVECHLQRAARSGQVAFDVSGDSLLAIADALMSYKYIVRNVARQCGKTATFMPKPLLEGIGNGLHVHLSLWKSGEPLFAGTGYAGLSDVGLHAIGGILKHAPALLAFTNPTTNSYRRLVPGSDAPTNLGYSQRLRAAACRIPMISPSPKAKRIEFRCPDPSCNPYLAFSAILMAVIDGIQNKVHPGEPMDRDIYDLAPELSSEIPQTPSSLEAALQALANDCEFLLRGDVFSEETLATWMDAKRQFEIAPLNLRPHPYEFCMYYDS